VAPALRVMVPTISLARTRDGIVAVVVAEKDVVRSLNRRVRTLGRVEMSPSISLSSLRSNAEPGGSALNAQAIPLDDPARQARCL
jgi:hypothetical protein